VSRRSHHVRPEIARWRRDSSGSPKTRWKGGLLPSESCASEEGLLIGVAKQARRHGHDAYAWMPTHAPGAGSGKEPPLEARGKSARVVSRFRGTDCRHDNDDALAWHGRRGLTWPRGRLATSHGGGGVSLVFLSFLPAEQMDIDQSCGRTARQDLDGRRGGMGGRDAGAIDGCADAAMSGMRLPPRSRSPPRPHRASR